MEMSQKQLQLVKEALDCYKEEIARATFEDDNVDIFLLKLTHPFIQAKRKEIETLSTLIDVLLEKDS